MTGFTGVSGLVTAFDANQVKETVFQKVGTSAEAAGVWHSLWNVGNVPAAGGAPATTPGTAYSSAGIAFDDTSSLAKFLTKFTVGVLNQTVQIQGIAMLYDRLVGVSGISLASTGDKTVSSTALTRYTDGVGVECWLEVTTATTTTAPVVTMNSYTDNDNNAGQTGTAVTFPAAATDLHALVRMTTAAGDNGVRAVSTINVGTAAAAGVVNVLLIKPLAYIHITGTLVSEQLKILQMLPPIRIYDGATLGIAYIEQSVASLTLQGSVLTVYN